MLLVCALSITIMIASYFAERSNRKSFIQKKQLQVGAYAYTEHTEVSKLVTDLFPFSPLIRTGSYKGEGRSAGEAEEGK